MLAIFFYGVPRSVLALFSDPCGQSSILATGYFFSDREEVYYESGLLRMGLSLQPELQDGRSFSVDVYFISDECLEIGSKRFTTELAPGSTEWSIRFASATQIEVWDDTLGVKVSEVTVPPYPAYTRAFIRPFIDGGASYAHTRTVAIREGAVPPEFPDTVLRNPDCVAALSSGYLFDSHERAEYVGGLLHLHMRLRTPNNDGRPFFVILETYPTTCDIEARQTTELTLAVPPYVRYFSLRMTSPTTWVLWNDESDSEIACEQCSGTIPESVYIRFTARIDGTASAMRSSAFRPSIADTVCVENCNSNVLFLPGIEGSRLYRPDYAGGTDRLWEPMHNDDVRDLFLNDFGEGVRDDIYVKTHDILDETPTGLNIYKSFITRMDALKADGKIADWEPIAYDWRLSPDSLLTRGYETDGRIYFTGLLAPTSTPYIVQELRHLAETSRTGKVTVIAHSYGGIIAKRLAETLGDDAARYIDSIILIGAPQVGTPMAIAAGMHGFRQELLYGLVLSKQVARAFASTSPMFYHLLPTEAYFQSIDSSVVTFDSSVPAWRSQFGASISSQSQLAEVLTSAFGKVLPEGDIDQPIALSQNLLASARTLHESIDGWVHPAEIAVVQIGGWGVETLKGITYSSGPSGVEPNARFSVNGDGTVVAPSALWMSGGERFWFDLDVHNRSNLIATLGGFRNFEHSRLLEADPVLNFIADTITKTRAPVSAYSHLSDTQPAAGQRRLLISLHSPLTLALYDSEGRMTGVSTTTGELSEGIPNSRFITLGSSSYAFVDASSPVSAHLTGTGSGTFTLVVEEREGDAVQAFTRFEDLPVSPETRVALATAGGYSGLSKLHIDQDGDGVDEHTLSPNLNSSVTLPPPPAPAPTLSPVSPAVASLGGGVIVSSQVTGQESVTVVRKLPDPVLPNTQPSEVLADSEVQQSVPSIESLPAPQGRVLGAAIAAVQPDVAQTVEQVRQFEKGVRESIEQAPALLDEGEVQNMTIVARALWSIAFQFAWDYIDDILRYGAAIVSMLIGSVQFQQ